MAELIAGCYQDVMQVCRNGHVITDRLRSSPERGLSHCERCGATTLHDCPTCGQDLPGAMVMPGMVGVGGLPPPQHCSACGTAFPWVSRAAPVSATEPLAALETLLRRLPRVIRQLRVRQSDRPPFRVEDERDLEDLLRALLPLHFEDIRPESRTPRYSPRTRTDFLLQPHGIAVLAKRTGPAQRERCLEEQLQEDRAYYAARPTCQMLLAFVYDPELLLLGPQQLETAWSNLQGELDVRVVIAS